MLPKRFELETLFEEYEHVPDMCVLGSSDARPRSVKDLLTLSGKSLELDDLELRYPPVTGNQALRSAVAGMYGTVSSEQVLITVGATEAIFLVLHALLERDDEALVCQPAFQSLEEMARDAGARVAHYAYDHTNRFQPDLGSIRAALKRPKPPKMLIINSPHNPTGHVLDEQTMRSLLSEAAKAGTFTVVDEVFSGIWIGSTIQVPSAVTLNKNAIIIGSLSKTFGLAGLRVGWLVGPHEMIQRCRQWRHYTVNCPPVIDQEFARIAIQFRDIILEENQATVRTNYAEAVAWLQQHGDILEWHEPQGGLFMLLKFKHDVDTERVVRDMATTYKVFIVPCAKCFGMPEGYLRLGLGSSPKRFLEGLRRMDAYLRSERWRHFKQ